jgi:hypothetical protein
MNIRIKLLAEQAGIDLPADSVYNGHIYKNAIERFAGLIVRECAQVSEDDITDGDACCTNTAYRIARQIKEHFGVKE